jgi:hypothetical protein
MPPQEASAPAARRRRYSPRVLAAPSRRQDDRRPRQRRDPTPVRVPAEGDVKGAGRQEPEAERRVHQNQ